MKKSLLIAAALCSSVMTANADVQLDSKETAAWATLSTKTADLADNDYVGAWGKLKLVNNQLCSENSNPIQLRGWSTFSINYQEVTPCLTEAGFDAMKAWGANVVRLAIYPKNSQGSWSVATDKTIEKYIKWANDRHMYCLIDWHVLDGDSNSGNPATYASNAKSMFADITSWVTSNGYKNCLYEICNECSGVSWSDIKSYADGVLPTIASGDPGAVVIVGTPQWDQNIGDAANNPIDKSKYNLHLMYAFHFYACSHTTLIGNLKSASASLPVFVSEWGSVAFDGGGSFCEGNSTDFLSYLKSDGNNGNQLISWCYWAWGQKNETSNCLQNCGSTYDENNLTKSGTYIVSILAGSTEVPKPKQSEFWEIQDIPSSTDVDWGVLNVGYFDKGGEMVAYHDNNSSKYKDPEKKCDDSESCYNTSGTEYKCTNAGAVYSGKTDLTECFRYNEDVDVSNTCAGLGANWGDPGDGLATEAGNLHNICMSEPGEWMLYTIDVKRAGYYTVKCMTNNSTSSKGTIGMVIAKGANPGQNGNIIRSWADHNNQEALNKNTWSSFALNPTPTCGLMYDGTIDANGAANGDKSQDWTCWGWTDCGATADDKADLTVLFKYTGVQNLQISISPDAEDSPGDFSNFAFTFKSADIPDFELTEGGVENATAEEANFTVAPNPTDGQFTVTVNGKANVVVTNVMGIVVFNEVVEGTATINKPLASGIYTVKAGNKTQKLIVK